MTYEIKNPESPATKKQTWTIFTLGGEDVRDKNLTRKEASDRIGELMAAKGITPVTREGSKSKGRSLKDARAAEFQKLWDKAVAAGQAAGSAHNPTPIRVFERTNPFNDNSPVKTDYGVYNEGVCGFAWVIVKPGTSAFARWLKTQGHARTDSYYGGVSIWISDYNQSYERKEAHAQAMTEVFQEAGIKASGMSRLD